MKTILCAAGFVVLLLALIPFFQARKRIHSWKDRLDEPVGDEDAAFISGRLKVFGILEFLAAALYILGILWDVIALIFT